MNQAFDLQELFKPVTQEEALRLPEVIRKLMGSADFRLLYRHMNQMSGGIHTSPFSLTHDPVEASGFDGIKRIPSWIFAKYLSTFGEKKPRQTQQKTEPPL